MARNDTKVQLIPKKGYMWTYGQLATLGPLKQEGTPPLCKRLSPSKTPRTGLDNSSVEALTARSLNRNSF